MLWRHKWLVNESAHFTRLSVRARARHWARCAVSFPVELLAWEAVCEERTLCFVCRTEQSLSFSKSIFYLQEESWVRHSRKTSRFCSLTARIFLPSNGTQKVACSTWFVPFVLRCLGCAALFLALLSWHSLVIAHLPSQAAPAFVPDVISIWVLRLSDY